jgi:hypothetical protein
VFGYEEAEVLEKHVEMLIPERLREMHGVRDHARPASRLAVEIDLLVLWPVLRSLFWKLIIAGALLRWPAPRFALPR